MAVICERAFLRVLDGSCRTPIAGYAEVQGENIRFRGLVAKPDGSEHYTVETGGHIKDALRLGEEAGRELLAKAGKDFLA
jgi:hydroxymethylbilane synthase